jgi:FAD/FMN-containing dehydrogenase
MDAAYPSGVLNYWKTGVLGKLDDGFIDCLVDAFAVVPSPMTAVAIEQLGGAVGRVSVDATAFAHRGAAYNLLMTSLWQEPTDSDRNIAWTRNLFQAIQPYAHGMYQNYLSGDEADDRLDSAYGANARRLAQVKRIYDPDNFFRMNLNIRPA